MTTRALALGADPFRPACRRFADHRPQHESRRDAAWLSQNRGHAFSTSRSTRESVAAQALPTCPPTVSKMSPKPRWNPEDSGKLGKTT